MDSAACIAAALQCACRDLGHPVPNERDARYVIGLGLDDALAHVLPGVAPCDYNVVVERYRHHFLLRDGGTTLFAGVAEMIQRLREEGHVLAIANGKSRRGLDVRSCDRLGQYFPSRGALMKGFRSRIRAAALDHGDRRISAERALMIGDTTHDREMARGRCCARGACLWGTTTALICSNMGRLVFERLRPAQKLGSRKTLEQMRRGVSPVRYTIGLAQAPAHAQGMYAFSRAALSI